ncbi:hypothetical protein GGI07_001264 [Coemansia sp. Benny D115]|nr:hypothetical protein GGI07_001264 [Coemansia sp. Benny D115]
MDAEMADAKDHHMDHEEQLHHEEHHLQQEHQVEDDQMGEHLAEEHDAQQYDQQYAESYDQQYAVNEEVVEGEHIYEDQTGAEYDQDPNGVAYEVAVDAAAAVASAAAAAAVPGDQEYAEQQVIDGNEEYTDEQQVGDEYADQGHEGYIDDPNAHQYDEQELNGQQEGQQGELVDDQTLAAHPATSRELEGAESMLVDGEHEHEHEHEHGHGHGHEHEHEMSTEVSQAMGRYDYSNNPDGLQTLAATSSAVTPHGTLETPMRSRTMGAGMDSPMALYGQKPMMPKFNRARNWSVEETKVLLAELDRIVNNNPDERRESILRSHATYEEIAEVLRNKGYSNRDGQGCMIRWRNLLRVYKQMRASMAEGNPPSAHQNVQYSSSIENIYRFPPDGMPFPISAEGTSPAIDSTSPTGHSRTWSQANGGNASFETPARKRTREINIMSEHIEQIDQRVEQTLEYVIQHSDIVRSLEERLARTEEALKSSEAALEALNSTINDKDVRRDELEKQLLATLQALSQVIASKKPEEQAQEDQ